MKTLQESLQNELICGKQLFEKLKIRKSTNKTISIPVVSYDDDIIYANEEWKEITLPKEKFIIYLDKYRGNLPHLSYIDDFLCSMMQNQDDYEDFDMNKDILFVSNDEQEIVEWYIRDYLKLELPDDTDDTTYWINSKKYYINSKKTNTRIHDNIDFIQDVYLGHAHIDDSLTLDKTSIESLAHSFNEIMGWYTIKGDT